MNGILLHSLKIVFYCLLFSCLSPLAHAQKEGDLYLYNYIPAISNVDSRNVAALQDRNGMMYFANTKGIITYDGVRWGIIDTRATPHALSVDSTDKKQIIYVGCTENFGYLEEQPDGSHQYISVSKTKANFGEITQILITQKYVYFYSDQVLFRVSKESKEIEEVWIAQAVHPYAGIFEWNGQIFLNIKDKGLHQIKGRDREAIASNQDFSTTYLNTAFPYKDAKIVLGTEENDLYLFDGKTFEPFVIEAQEYIQDNLLTTGIQLSNRKIVLATLYLGV